MKLNVDCIRDILLTVEASPFNAFFTCKILEKELPSYTEYEIWYNVLKLHEAKFITAKTKESKFSHLPEVELITDITYKGHEFLNTVREVSIWNHVKNICHTIGSSSVHTMFEIGKTIISECIKKHIK